MGIYKVSYIGNWFRKEIMFVNAKNEYEAMTTALKIFPFTFKVKDVNIENVVHEPIKTYYTWEE